MAKRPIAATLLTTAGLVLLLTFKTPDIAPIAASNGGNTGNTGTTGSGANVVTTGNGGNAAAAQTAGTKGTASGQFTGTAVQTSYGTVQVQVTMQNGRITDVQALQLPTGRGHTQQLSAYAGPQLRSEVLAAQSANVNTISGATYTSEGYMQSVQSALDQVPA
jgi:uncharacterized protein with FMN-binding domain